MDNSKYAKRDDDWRISLSREDVQVWVEGMITRL